MKTNDLVVGTDSKYEIKFIGMLPNEPDSITQVYSYAIYKSDESRIIDLVYIHRVGCYVEKAGNILVLTTFFAVSSNPIVTQVKATNPIFDSHELAMGYLQKLCEKQNQSKI